MSIKAWIKNSHRRFRDEGFTGARLSVEELWWGVLRRVPISTEESDSVEDWNSEIIVILDTCTGGLLKEVSEDYDWLPDSIPQSVRRHHTVLNSPNFSRKPRKVG